MANTTPLRIRLAQNSSISEIERMIANIENDPDSRIGAMPPSMLNKASMKKLDEMTWAIYTISKRNKDEHIMETPPPQMKNW
jgi:hypothetical protein